MDISTMGARIKFVRTESKLTQQAFADRAGISRGALANYEVDRNEPLDAVITLICREFGINENWLRYGTGDMKAETTQKQKLTRFFADVLATAPDDRSAFIAALDDLSPEFWPLVVELAKGIVKNVKEKED